MQLDKLGIAPKALEGVWVDYTNPSTEIKAPGVRLLIASSASDAYATDLETRLTAATNKNLKGGRRDLIPKADARRDAETSALARHVLLDFQGIEGADGKALNGSSIGDRMTILSTTNGQVREFVLAFAADLAKEQAEKEEEQLGNSESSASSTSG